MASMAVVALAEAEVASVAAWGRRERRLRRSSMSSSAALGATSLVGWLRVRVCAREARAARSAGRVRYLEA